MTALDRLVERLPWLKAILEFVAEHGDAIVFGGGFATLMLLLCYWMFIVVPRRAQRIFAGLVSRGFQALDRRDSALKEVLATLAPLYEHEPLLGTTPSPWGVKLAAVTLAGSRTRYVVDATRGQKQMGSGGTSAGGSSYVLRRSVMLLEKGRLELPTDLHISTRSLVPRLVGGVEERHGLQPAAGDFSPEFGHVYEVHTSDGLPVAIPQTLQEALVAVYPRFELGGSSSPYLWGTRLRFGPDGWGMSTTERFFYQEPMDLFLEAADTITAALG